jgi:hypothetical protein
MLNITLKPDDTIETVLPVIEQAMEDGDVCRIVNMRYIGLLGKRALTLLTQSDGLLDSQTGKVFHSHPGFSLVEVDDKGQSSVLL